MSDWADKRAREWAKKHAQDLTDYSYALSHNWWIEYSAEEEASLADLLREVQDAAKRASHEVTLKATLAEVRGIVDDSAGDVALACITDEERDAVKALRGALLARIDALDAPRISTEEEAKAVMGDGQALTKLREIK